MTFRHRHLIEAPFAVLAVVVLAGGLLNSTDLRGQVLDELTERGVPDATVTHGTRSVKTDFDGGFVFLGLPRTSQIEIQASGYTRTKAPTTAYEIRLSPHSVTIHVSEDGAPETRVKAPQARQGAKILSTGNQSGQITVNPHPGKDAMLLICAEGYESKEIKVEGVLMEMTLRKGGTGCPPIPTPTPAPTPTPGASPSPRPASSPTATPPRSP